MLHLEILGMIIHITEIIKFTVVLFVIHELYKELKKKIKNLFYFYLAKWLSKNWWLVSILSQVLKACKLVLMFGLCHTYLTPDFS